MMRVVVRLSVTFCMISGAGLSVRADTANLLRSGLDAVQAERWDDAVRLLTQAINERQLSSGDRAHSHQLRALAYFTRGEFDRVIADSTAALRAEPNYEGALRLRGLARLYAGRPMAAIDDFAAAVRLTPSDVFGVILLHIARVRAQQSDDQEFTANVARVDRREWPGRLVEVLTGGATADQVGDFIMTVRDEKVRLEQICEAQVYLGLLQLAARDKGEARTLFNAAVSDCPPAAAEALELTMAKLELRRLGNVPATATPNRRPPSVTPVAQEPSLGRVDRSVEADATAAR
jgi:lipoprotein NlpI